MKHYFLFVLLGYIISCSNSASNVPSVETTAPAPVVEAPEPLPAPTYATGFITNTGMVRYEPQDGKFRAGVMGGPQVSNFLTIVYRGEPVTILESQPVWTHIKLSDERDGWVKAEQLLTGNDVKLATTIQVLKTFDRPDLLSLNTNKKVNVGSLILVLRNKDQFSEINTPENQNIWVLTESLSQDKQEIDAAKLIARAQYMKDHKDNKFTEIIDLAKTQYAQTKLVQALYPAPTEASTSATEMPNTVKEMPQPEAH